MNQLTAKLQALLGPRAGVIAACLLSVYLPAIFFDGLIQRASLDLFLMSAVLALLGEFQERCRPLFRARAQAMAGDPSAALASLGNALRIATATGQPDRVGLLEEIIRQTKIAIAQ